MVLWETGWEALSGLPRLRHRFRNGCDGFDHSDRRKYFFQHQKKWMVLLDYCTVAFSFPRFRGPKRKDVIVCLQQVLAAFLKRLRRSKH
jgi:hypothetical protein